ncbi:glycosyltransferase [Pseudomonas simiae]|uniref:glycosyltransferase n=1 Tax=Pseudomonas simiae TaxID=321846 RepID=UPI0027346894|nr:glycosyltransferase [Pseudomonas simiae]WLG32703.1 glycosyltransferase [Pseudomonas simiae]WLI22694.1 glycosyltransferase [Pseudomonas simiae]
MFKLDQYGYTKDGKANVWVRSDFQGIAYSDGDDAETELAGIIDNAKDVTVLSDELPQYCTDWAKLYHLSATRANILRPFEHLFKSRVLEIGAGCGAISRYLGECGADLLCLEGSPRRAAMAASRTRDLDNVTVLAERFDDFKIEEQFDVVTLIGVLEYASMFSNADDPALAMLMRVRQLLKPDGHLFIAIENQLGLKYFAGAPEDHVGITMYGIEGRYEHGQPKTYGRKELKDLIVRAGFTSTSFLAPSPDYKLPNSIITESGFECDEFDASALAWQNVKKDPQLPEQTTFNLEKAWSVVIDNRLGMDLANSFLIVASCERTQPLDKAVLAYHYSTGRKTRYCKESLFVKTPQGIQVRYRKLGSVAGHKTQADLDDGFKYVLPRMDAYAKGSVLSLEFLDVAARRDWSVKGFTPFLQKYLACLQILLQEEGADVKLLSAKSVLPGRYIDAVPQNIVVGADGIPQFIDVEWEMDDGVELGYLMMRALLLLMAAASPFYPSTSSVSRQEFVTQLLASAGIDISAEDLNRYIAIEAAFQERVTGADAIQFLNWSPEAMIHKLGAAHLPSNHAKLYISDDAGNYSEESSLLRVVDDGQQVVRFTLPAGLPRGVLLRFDPINRRQSFSIHTIKVYSSTETIFEWQDDIGHPLIIASALRIPQVGRNTLYLALSDDPSVVIPLKDETFSGTELTELEVSFTLFTEEQLAQEIDVLNQSGLTSDNSELQSKLDMILDSNSKLDLIVRSSSKLDQLVELNREIVDVLELMKASITSNTSEVIAQAIREKDKEVQLVVEQLRVQSDEHRASIQLLTEQKDLALDEKDAQIEEFIASAALENPHSEAERLQIIATLDQKIAVKDDVLQNTLAKWKESLRVKDVHISNLEERLRIQQVQKDTHIHNLNLQIIAMQSSSSWKVTAPFRKLVKGVSQSKRLWRLLPSVIRRGGGLRSTVRKTIAVWRQHGIAGLKSRVVWAAGGSNFAFIGQEIRAVPDRHDYSRWVEYYDTLDDNCRWKMGEEIRKWKVKPLISIIMPVYNPPMDFLREAVESVKSQLYKNWELCIADDASTDPEVVAYLKSLRQQDQRIKVVFRRENGHISNASNSALELASGQYIALMDNDDLVAEHALYWVARTIHDCPDVGVIYSDEDKIDAAGKRSSPYFKSDWNEFLFRSQNMVCHLGVYRLDLVKSIGGFRVGFEGSQDYDLALRCVEKLERNQIVHIPRILYHWRSHAGSTAMAGDEKPYAALAGVKALNEHLQRIGDIGTAELLPMGMYRIHYSRPVTSPLVTLIIPTRNAHMLVKQCIDSIQQLTTYTHYEVILIDNGSDDAVSLEYFAELERHENVRVLRDNGPFNYSALNNRAVRMARGELIGLINNDIEVITPDWLSEMVSIALQPNVGAVGARLWYPDDRLQHGGVVVGVGGVAGHSHKYLPKGDYGYFCRAALTQEFSAVTAACLIIKKSIFEQVGGLDEENLKIAFNDVDFCLRVQEAGYINVWTPFAELYHHESATRGLEDTPEKKERFSNEVVYIQRRWPNIQEDYAYSPNLTLDHEDFGLAWPPRVKL